MVGLFIIYDVAYDDEILKILDFLNIKGYTKWTKVLGRGERSNPKMDDPVWPGFNCMIFITLNENDKINLIEQIKHFKLQKNIEGIKVYEIPVVELI